MIPNVMAEYNTKNKDTITGMTPAEARKPSAHVDAETAMELVARRGPRFPTSCGGCSEGPKEEESGWGKRVDGQF